VTDLWHYGGVVVVMAGVLVCVGAWALWRYRTMSESAYEDGLRLMLETAERELAGDPISHAEFILMTATGRRVEAKWDSVAGARVQGPGSLTATG